MKPFLFNDHYALEKCRV